MFKSMNKKYAIRKLATGAGSVVIGLVSMGAIGSLQNTVYAAETTSPAPSTTLAAPAPSTAAPAIEDTVTVTADEAFDEKNVLVTGGTHPDISVRHGESTPYVAQGTTSDTVKQAGTDGTTVVEYKVVYDSSGKEISRQVISGTTVTPETTKVNEYTPKIVVDEHEIFNKEVPGDDINQWGGVLIPKDPTNPNTPAPPPVKRDDIFWTDGVTKEFAKNMVFGFNTWEEFISKNQNQPGFELFINFILAQEKYRLAMTATSKTTGPNEVYDYNTGNMKTVDNTDIDELIERSKYVRPDYGNNDSGQVDLVNYSLKDKINLLNHLFYTSTATYNDGTPITDDNGNPVKLADRIVQSFKYYITLREYWKAHEDIKHDTVVRFNPNLKSSKVVLVKEGKNGRIGYVHFDYGSRYIDNRRINRMEPTFAPLTASTPLSTATRDASGIIYVMDFSTGRMVINANSYQLISDYNKNIAKNTFSYNGMTVGGLYSKTIPVYMTTMVPNPNFDPALPESPDNQRYTTKSEIMNLPLDVLITEFTEASTAVYEYGVDPFVTDPLEDDKIPDETDKSPITLVNPGSQSQVVEATGKTNQVETLPHTGSNDHDNQFAVAAVASIMASLGLAAYGKRQKK